MKWLFWVFWALIVATATAAEVRLIYPRLEAGQDSFRYSTGLDSSFVFGHVEGFTPECQLKCNEHAIELTEDGAFLAFLPLVGSEPETSAWSFTLIQGGTDTSVMRFPYGWQAPTVEPAWQPFPPPAWCKIGVSNAHIRTSINGSYLLFPQKDTPLKVVAVGDKFVQVYIAPGLTGAIEKRFIDQTPISLQSEPLPLRIGNARVQESRIVFEVSRTPLWSAETEGSVLVLNVYDAVAAVDRIHFSGSAREVVRDITWKQRPEGVELRINIPDPEWRGYRIDATDSTLVVNLNRRPWAKSGLRGKRIVLDPGHGGSADGAIGPRGTKEKDVTLNWAQILASELKRKGADVSLTREADTSLGLYERIEFARSRDCDVFLSLHANALPDGENPALRHGCGTYYYHSLSRPLAACIQDAIIKRTGSADDGILDANLAVVRPTEFPAVLIESAYLMHPEEELLLRDSKFLRNLSRGVLDGLESYFRKSRTR